MHNRGLSKSAKWRRTRNRIAVALVSLFALLLVASTRLWVGDHEQPVAQAQSVLDGSKEGQLQPTLVIYVLSLADVVYLENFYFFYHEAILRDTTAQYDILVADAHYKDPLLPPLPPHARYVRHNRSCVGLRLVRWYLRAGPGAASIASPAATANANSLNGIPFARFVLATSAVRGPFIPPGLRDLVTWHAALGGGSGSGNGAGAAGDGPGRSEAAPADIAGAVVSCAQPPAAASGDGGGDEDEDPDRPPFPEFTAIAASRAAIQLLLDLPPDQLPDCPSPAAAAEAPTAPAGEGPAPYDPAAVLAADGLTAAEAAAMSALRAWSGAALGAGLRLGSLAVRQRGVDWSDRRTWGCNGGVHPLSEASNDGLTLTPYEALFVPLSSWDDPEAPYGTPAEYGRVYSEWMQAAAAEAGDAFPALDGDLTSLAAAVASVSALLANPHPAAAIATASAAGNFTQPQSPEGGVATSAAVATPGDEALAATAAAGADGNSTGSDGAPAATAAAATELPSRASRNRYYEGGGARYKLPGVLYGVALGPGCFDAEHYQQANPDLGPMPGPGEAWKFWVFVGQFQPRVFRLKCSVDWSKFGFRTAAGARTGGKG